MTREDSLLDPVAPLAEEFAARVRRGEQPSVTEYVARHPDLADRLRQVLPMMVLMDEAASADRTGTHTGRDADLPDLIGGYRILREVGRGGMGVVYEAEQESLGRRVALKVLAAAAIPEPKQLLRFHREAKAAARLHHTNIVPVFGVGEGEGVHYYVMQFIQGLGLDAVLDEVKRLRGDPSVTGSGPAAEVAQSLLTGTFINEPQQPVSPRALPEPDAPARGRTASLAGASGSGSAPSAYPRAVVRLGVQVAEALGYAHAQGVLHRDIKPSNLLLDNHGTLWITDFGLAKASDSADLTHTGDIIGTVRYMAPERFQGRCDARSDVYALGLTLYELLTLTPAFDAADRLRLMDQIAHREPPRPRSLDPRIPRDLETIVMTAIDKDPARRYPSAEALAADLRRFLADEPIAARRIGPAERLARWARRNPVVASLSAAVIVVAAAGFLGVFGQWQVALAQEQKANQQRDDARQQRDEVRALNEKLQRTLYTAHMNLAHNAWEAGGVGRVRELLEQHRPKPGESDLRGFEWFYLYRLCHAELLTLKGHTNWVHSVAYSPDGKRLASAGWDYPGKTDHTVKVWDAQAGQELLTIKGGGRCVAFSPDGKRLASAAGADPGSDVKVWDAQTGQELLTLQGHTGAVWSVVFSPDGKRLASASLGRWEVKVWDAQTGQELLTLNGVRSVAFTPDGKRLASAAGAPPGNEVKVWDVQTGQELLTLKGHTALVQNVAFSPDGKRLASAAWDYTVKVWDAQTGQELLTLKGHTSKEVLCVHFSPDGKRLASGSVDKTVKLWDVQTGQELLTLQGHNFQVESVAFSPDGNRLASAGSGGEVKVWDAQTGQKPLTLKGAATPLGIMAFSPDGKRLASGSLGVTGQDAGEGKVWDAQTGQELFILKGRIHGVAFSPDGKRLASGSHDGTVKLWDAQTGQELLTIKGHTSSVLSVAFSADGKRLASGSWDKTVKVWDAQTGRELLTIEGHSGGVNSVAFSPDGKRLACASLGLLEVKVWDAQTGQELLTLQGIRSVAFSPDGKRLASPAGARPASEVKVRDVQTGQELLTLQGHTDSVWGVAFSPDGKRLASASGGEVKVWDAQTGQETLTLKGGHSIYNGVAFSPDGHRLASGSVDGTVKIWDATPLPPK